MILEIENLQKTVPGGKILKGVDFQLEEGEIHALVGANGAGKTSLIKVLTGVYPKDTGTIRYDGEYFEPENRREAELKGVCGVYHEVNLLNNLTVAENLFMERQPQKLGLINWKEINRRSVELLKDFSLDIDVTRELSVYSIAVQQMVSVARATEIKPKVLALDEPTSSLNQDEAELLFHHLRRLRSEGCAIIFATHFLDQVYEFCDRVTVLRYGENVGTWKVGDISKDKLIGVINGVEEEGGTSGKLYRQLGDEYEVVMPAVGQGATAAGSAYMLHTQAESGVELADIFSSGSLTQIDLRLKVRKAESEETRVVEKVVRIDNPSLEGLSSIELTLDMDNEDKEIDALSVEENIILALQVKRGWFSLLAEDEQSEYAREYAKLFFANMDVLQQKVASLDAEARRLVLHARQLVAEPALVMLEEKGCIEISERAEGSKFVLCITPRSSAIIFISAELERVIQSGDSVRVCE